MTRRTTYNPAGMASTPEPTDAEHEHEHELTVDFDGVTVDDLLDDLRHRE